MKQTQKQLIVRYLQEVNDWIPAYKLRGLNTPFGFLGHQADRRARELAQAGLIDHKIENAFAYYRAKEVKKIVYRPLDDFGRPYKEIVVPQLELNF